MGQKKISVWLVVLVVLVSVLMLSMIYLVWDVATSRVSGEMDCSSDYIQYITYNWSVFEPKVDCIMPIVQSGSSVVCALPRDFHCKFTLQNFPIMRAVIEGIK